ncbi:MAG: DUF2460 domain-containing protein [Pseudomonadota bacterium]
MKRFDARFWTVDFPRPIMAAVTTTAPDALRVDAVFYKADDLAGLIWASEDVLDHPLLAYETSRDYRGCALKFRWQSAGIMPLDAINGPTLTIEGRDAAGVPKSWFVRLWNYATGTNADALISLDFDALSGGFMFPQEADPVFAGDIDRMFISLAPPSYTGVDTPLAVPVEGWVTLTEIACTGASSTLEIGDVIVPAHGLSMATGYDDAYNQTPARFLRSILQLGYRGDINHYVGMSHYFRLEALSGGFYASLNGGVLNQPCRAWHGDFAARAKALGYGLILSLSYELYDAHAYNDWKQRAFNGDPAATGYVPPSTLLSPAHAGAMGYLQSVARAFVQIAVDAGQAPRFQVGEPWWWVMPDKRICLYDGAAKAAFGGNPVEIVSVTGAKTAVQNALLDAAGAMLAASTAELVAAVRLDHPAAQALLLPYLPTVLDEAAPELKRANVPIGWASPAFDILQLEDYDYVTSGNRGASARGVAVAEERLGYPPSKQHYFAGFVLRAEDKAQWALIDAAAEVGRARGVAATFIWAQPQVLRDGYVHFDEGERVVQAFDDVQFPLSLGRGASVTPGFSTAIVTTASGHEQRNADWASGRLRFDAGPGVRSEADLQTLIGFFRARRGAARGFRFRDPYDFSSRNMAGAVTAGDQLLGLGDGMRTEFPLIKRYGAEEDGELRRITRPVMGSVLVSLGGMLSVSGWSLLEGGVVSFNAPPGAGVQVRAGFQFDVPVRFAEDSLEIDAALFAAGDVPSVPLIEVREG